MSKRIGFGGMGLMGSRMSRNLLKKGFPTTVWIRTPERCEPLVREGARVARTPFELAEHADVVVACVADPPAVERLVFAEDGLLGLAELGRRLGLQAADEAAKLLHGPIGLLAFVVIGVAIVDIAFALLAWWGGLATGQDDWAQTGWFYLRAIIPPALFVLATLLVALGLLMIVNAVVLNPVRRLGVDLLSTLVAGSGAPEWAGHSKGDLVVRMPIPEGLSTTSFDAPPDILREAKLRAHDATCELLQNISWPTASQQKEQAGRRRPN